MCYFRMWLKHILLLCAVLALVLVEISAKKHHHNKYGREHNKKVRSRSNGHLSLDLSVKHFSGEYYKNCNRHPIYASNILFDILMESEE